ncbi:MAG: FAD-dependent oxidoreductase [Proteobacteria bacterium]|nr:FAD-dependent oxidoreductase [Pseudomonadota bacterium]
MAKKSARIAIVGAGISGLAAAYKLSKAGFDPVIFEKESFVGGRMSSKNLDGFIIDKAAYTIPQSHKNLRRFLKEMEMKSSLALTPGTYSTFSAGKEYKFKIGSAINFYKSELFSTQTKKEIIKLFLYSRTLGNTLSLLKPRKKTFSFEAESAAEYLSNNYNKQVLEYFAYPLFCEMFLGTPENNSKLAFLASIKTLHRLKIFALEKGMGSLPERMARQLNIRLNTPVLEINFRDRSGPFEVHAGGENPESHVFDALIFALPTPVIPSICKDLPKDLKECFYDTPYAPSIVTALAVDRKYPETSMINSVLRKDFRVLGNIIVDDHKGPYRVPEGRSLITTILCEQASRRLFLASNDKIINEVLNEMDFLYPGFSGRLIFPRVYRWKYGALQLKPGLLSKQQTARKALEDKLNNFYIAGDGLYWSGLEVSFNTGMQAAKQIIKKMGKKTRS